MAMFLVYPLIIVGLYMVLLYGLAEVLPHYWRLTVRAWAYYFMLEMLCLMLAPAEAMQFVGFKPQWGGDYVVIFMQYFPEVIINCLLKKQYDILLLILIPIIPAIITYRLTRSDDQYIEQKRKSRINKKKFHLGEK